MIKNKARCFRLCKQASQMPNIISASFFFFFGKDAFFFVCSFEQIWGERTGCGLFSTLPSWILSRIKESEINEKKTTYFYSKGLSKSSIFFFFLLTIL